MGIETALIAGTVASTAGGLFASKSAADAQESAAQNANATQLAMFRQNRADMEPWRIGGEKALSAYLYELGIGPKPQSYRPGSLAITNASGTPVQSLTPTVQDMRPRMTREGPVYDTITTPSANRTTLSGVYNVGGRTFNTLAEAQAFANRERDARDTSFEYKGFQTSPGYRFLAEEGQRAIDRNLASRGLFFSGPAAKETTRFHTGLLNQEYGTYMNRLAEAAGMGQTQANKIAGLGTDLATNIANNQLNTGNARASSYLGMANTATQGLGNLSQYFMLRNMGAFTPAVG